MGFFFWHSDFSLLNLIYWEMGGNGDKKEREMKSFMGMVLVALLLFVPAAAQAVTAFNGHAEYGTYACGTYYMITGGIFPTGPVPNGQGDMQRSQTAS